MSAEISFVCLDAVRVEIVGPYRFKGMPAHLREPQGHAARAGEYVDQSISVAFPCKLAVVPVVVDALVFFDQPSLISYVLILQSISHLISILPFSITYCNTQSGLILLENCIVAERDARKRDFVISKD